MKTLKNITLGGILFMVMGFATIPFLWQAITSIKPTVLLTSLPPLFPDKIVADHYHSLLENTAFLRSILNSLVVSILLVPGFSRSICLGKITDSRANNLAHIDSFRHHFPSHCDRQSPLPYDQRPGTQRHLVGLGDHLFRFYSSLNHLDSHEFLSGNPRRNLQSGPGRRLYALERFSQGIIAAGHSRIGNSGHFGFYFLLE